MSDAELLVMALARIVDLTARVDVLTARVLEAEHQAEVARGVTAMLVDGGHVTLASLLGTEGDDAAE